MPFRSLRTGNCDTQTTHPEADSRKTSEVVVSSLFCEFGNLSFPQHQEITFSQLIGDREGLFPLYRTGIILYERMPGEQHSLVCRPIGIPLSVILDA